MSESCSTSGQRETKTTSLQGYDSTDSALLLLLYNTKAEHKPATHIVTTLKLICLCVKDESGAKLACHSESRSESEARLKHHRKKKVSFKNDSLLYHNSKFHKEVPLTIKDQTEPLQYDGL